MQSLFQTLQDHDTGHLKVIAEIWGLDLPSGTSLEFAKFLAECLSTPEFISDLEESLPKPTLEVLQFLLEHDGHVPLPNLVRSFGSIREMGAGRRDRDKPWRDPISPLEDLWYRGLCAKTFIDTPTGAQEYIFIPIEIMKELSTKSEGQAVPLGHKSSTPSEIIEAQTSSIEDATTLLAYLRKSPPQSLNEWQVPPENVIPFLHRPESAKFLLTLFLGLEIVHSSTLEPKPVETKSFLETPSESILYQLFNAWRTSIAWNDLAEVAGLRASNDDWPNDPLVSRNAVLSFLTNIPRKVWWDVEGLIRDIRTTFPSFQRPAGDFDSWYLFRRERDEFLQGFENWDPIEGDLIRYILSRPLHWLGVVDIGRPPKSSRSVAFRLTHRAGPYLDGEKLIEGTDEDGRITMLPDGLIRASSSSNRAMRYQIARFTDWVSFDGDTYSYRITPNSLQLASEGGLGLDQFHSILIAACENVPPTISKALIRWDAKGVEASVEKSLVLRVQDPEILQSLLSNPRTAKFILEKLSPTSAIIHESSQTKLYQAALQTGLLLDLARDE